MGPVPARVESSSELEFRTCRNGVGGESRQSQREKAGTALVQARKSFGMCSCEKCARKPFEMCTYERLDLKSFGFCTYEKRVGGGEASLLSLPGPVGVLMTHIVVRGADFGGPATFDLDRIYRAWPVTALSTRTAARKGDPRCHPSGK